MKVTCNRESLLAAFQTAAAVAPSRSPKPILQNVKFEVSESAAIVLATDLEVGVRTIVPEVDVQVPGSAIFPVARFGSILRESSDEQLRIEADPQGTIVRGERSEFRLPGENPHEFPAVADFTESKYHELPARLLKELIRRTVFATDNESSRYALGGVLLEFLPDKIIGVGTDGRRLAKMEVPAQSVGGHQSGDSMTIVMTKAMTLIERALTDPEATIQISARANEVLVKTPRTTLYSRLVEGRFPKWRDVFPQRAGAAKIELTVGPLYSAVRQAAIVTSEESRGIDLYLIYTMRRVHCPRCGVKVEQVPWAEGKALFRPVTSGFGTLGKAAFHERGGSGLWTTWEHVFRSVKHAVSWACASEAGRHRGHRRG